ncbi:MAG: class I SAM-dependent methyltransferase [Elusimicrobiota bacterium]
MCKTDSGAYYKCAGCFSAFLDPAYYLSKHKEKARYDTHNNDPFDSGYKNFVMPIVSEIKKKFSAKDPGLDFGCGSGAPISAMLSEEGYKIHRYDPFFVNNKRLLKNSYDYIACCEVIEHFHNPADEFNLLRKMLNKNGGLFCKTEIFSGDVDFEKWYYKNDPTHVFFYSREAFKFICEHFAFKSFEIRQRLIFFEG